MTTRTERIDHPRARGGVHLHGAHVTSWALAGGSEVLWVSPDTSWASDKAIRGGIPLCLPWFGSGVDGPFQPSHGPGRLAEWRVVASYEEDAAAHRTFELSTDDVAGVVGAQHWPDGLTARYDVAMGEHLTVALTLALGTAAQFPARVEMAVHTYFAVGDVREVAVRGLAGWPGVDKAHGGEQVVLAGDQHFYGEVDRIFTGTGVVEIVDADRIVRIERENSAQVIVWNPGEELASTMGDLTTSQWNRFVCVESGNVGDHALTLSPGESTTMTTTYAVTPA